MEAANGDASAWARWAGGIGAGAKLSGWLLAVGGVLYVLSWLTGVGEIATIAAFMGVMLASTIVLSTTESELRIKAASQAKTPKEFKEQVTKAARTNAMIMVGLLALALAFIAVCELVKHTFKPQCHASKEPAVLDELTHRYRFVAKTYFPETVAKISKPLAKFKERLKGGAKLSEVKGEFVLTGGHE